MKNITFYILLNMVCLGNLKSQDLDKLLDNETGDQTATQYATATFKSTRIITGQSIERMPARQLDFRISHRFGELNTGAYNLWGLDQANIHIGMDYGITNKIMVGFGHGTYEKTYDGFIKYSILRQCSGERNVPVSLSYFVSAAINTLKSVKPDTYYFWDRVSYVHQLLVARKFSEKFSFELNPTYVHRNLVGTAVEANDLFAMGAGARYKLSKRVSINAEYHAVFFGFKDYRDEKTYNPLSIGVDIETGGHVFQIQLTNSLAMIEKGFIGETTGQWSKGGIHLGFNISRVFSFK